MTVQHTMTPGRIVHYYSRGECVAAVLDKVVGAGAGVVSLVRISDRLSDGRSTLAVERAHTVGHMGHLAASWHWTDECPQSWPETD